MSVSFDARREYQGGSDPVKYTVPGILSPESEVYCPQNSSKYSGSLLELTLIFCGKAGLGGWSVGVL